MSDRVRNINLNASVCRSDFNCLLRRVASCFIAIALFLSSSNNLSAQTNSLRLAFSGIANEINNQKFIGSTDHQKGPFANSEENTPRKTFASISSTGSGGNWNTGSTWVGGVVPGSSDDVTIVSGAVVTETGNQACLSININSGGRLDLVVNTDTLDVYSNWVNDGTFNATLGVVRFKGTGSHTISGGSASAFYDIVVDKGTNPSNVIEANGVGALSNTNDISIKNGMFKMTTGTFQFKGNYSIPTTGGIWVNGATMSSASSGTCTNDGYVKVSSGTANFGTGSGNELHNQGKGYVDISGGTVNISGRLINTASGATPLTGIPATGMSISGATITVCTVGNGASSTGSFDMSSSSILSMTGGTVIFQNNSSAATPLDLDIISGSGSKTISGGTFQIGNASTPGGKIFRVFSGASVYNFTVNLLNTPTVDLKTDFTINNQLDLNGPIYLNFQNLIMGSSAPAITGVFGSAAGMVVCNNGSTGGELRKLYSGNGLFKFPMGEIVSTIEYSPITLTFNSGTYAGGAYAGIKVVNAKHPNNTNTTNYTNRYWVLNTSGISSANYDADATYKDADVVGTEANLVMGFYPNALPWVKYSATNTATNVLHAAGITTTGTGLGFTGISNVAPTVVINDASFCTGGSVLITPTVTGDPTITYSWTGPSGFTSTASSVTVSTAGTYILTITDGNGFQATDNAIITENPAPTAFSVTGGGSYCSGGSGLPVGLNGSETGVNYQLKLNGSNILSPLAGTNGALNFGNQTSAGTYTILATNTTTGCTATMTGSVIISINPLPTASVNSPTICASAGSATITATVLTGASPFAYSWTVPGGANPGNVASFSATVAGTYSVIVTDANGCNSASASGTLTINANPNPPTGTNGSRCGNGTVNISATPGAGETIDWYANPSGGAPLLSGSNNFTTPVISSTTVYYAEARNTTTGCVSTTRTAVTATVNSLPAAPTVTNGSRCGTGTVLISATPGAGETIDWYAALSGGSALLSGSNNFTTPSISSTTTYYVEARNTTTGCVSAPRTPVTATVNAIPTAFNVTAPGGTAYCSGGSGITINLSGSQVGVSYQLVQNAINIGSAVAGTGSGFNFTNVLVGDGTAYTVVATGAGPCSNSMSGAVVVTVTTTPTTADAGPDQTGSATCGLTTVTLAANSPSSGTGAWSIISGAGGSFGNASSNTSTFTGTAGTTYILRWTISNPPCTASTDDVVITFNQNPTTANAGPDQTGASTCGLTTVTLAGNAATIGTGAWSIISGAGGSFGNASSPTSTFTGTAGTTYTLRWTISNSPCTASTDDVVITFNQNPTTSVAGSNQSICSNGTATLAANSPSIGTGTWSVTSGPSTNSSQFNSVSSPGAIFTPAGGAGAYVLQWSIANTPCAASNSTLTITVTNPPSATISYSGSPYCSNGGTASVTLTGTSGGTYSSTVGLSINGANGLITLGTSTAGTYSVTYTIAASGGCSQFQTSTNVTITALPVATFSYTGTPYCQNASNPSPTFSGGGVAGTFSSTAGLVFVSTSTGQVNLSASTAGTYTVTNTIAAANGCAQVFATSSITITALPVATFSYAGTPYCQSASNPSPTFSGGGVAGTFSSTAGLVFVSTATGQVNLSASTVGTYTVTNTIAAANGCAQVQAQSNITISPPPSALIAYTGSPYCANAGTATVTRAGDAGGTYTSTAGLSINSSNGDVNLGASTAGTYTVTYTIAAANGCLQFQTTASITINALPTTSNAGPDQTVCIATATLAGNTPTIGAGSWTIISGSGAVTTPSSPTSGVTGLVVGSPLTVRWTIANSPCPSSTDDVVITRTATPVAPVSLAGSNAACTQITANWNASVNATSYILDVSTVNTFASFVAGYNGLNVGNVTTYDVTGLAAGTTYFYRVRATNICGTSANSGTITYATSALPSAPVATAGTGAACTQITANWNAAANATSYILDVSTVNTFASFVAGYNGLNVGNVTTYNVTGLTAGVTYYYRVRASNSCGTSANSGTITYATSPATPATPGAITGTVTQCPGLAGQIYSITAVANATTYTWAVPSGWTITAGAGTISITVTTGNTGDNGNITVTAGNSCGTSASNSLAVTVGNAAPSAPVSLAGSGAACTQITANWNASVNATAYILDVSTVNTFASFVAGYNGLNVGNVTTYNVTGLVAGTTYYYRIRATNSCGTSANSGTITYATSPATPAAPVSTAGTNAACTQITANWNASANATSYILDVSTVNTFASFVAGYNGLNVGNVTTYDVTGLTAGTTYYYRVRATNSCGTSANSGTITYATSALPSAPVATAGTGAACTQITANWNAAANATSYILDVSTVNTFASFVAGYNGLNVGNVTTYNVTGLTAGVTYYYRVRATNSCGTSANSGTITYATSPATPATPGAITGTVTQCPGLAGQIYSITAVANATTYTWAVPSGWTITAGAGTISITVTTGNTGDNGNITVTAGNSCGTSASNSLAVTVGNAAPSAPVSLAGSGAACTQITANWNASVNATAYILDVSTVNTFASFVAGYNGLNVGNVTTFNVTGLTAGTTYFYRVRATNSCGTSANSGTITYATSPATPAAPVSTAGTNAACTQITANWNASANATSYILDVSTVNNFASFVAGYNGLNVGNVTTYDVTGLTAGTTYFYRVRATNSCGTSANSGTITYATSPATPAAPVATAGTGAACTQITANWNAAANATSYILDVSTVNTFASFVAGYNGLNVGNVTTYNVTGLTAGTTYFYRVRATNSCGTSANSGTITYATSPATPATPGAITGTATQCPSLAGQVYSITAVANATTYTWTVPSGWTITLGAGTISITVTTGNTGDNGNITVTAGNSCGTSAANSLAVTVGNAAPSAPVSLAGSGAACTQITANWNASVNATAYILDVSTVNTFASFVAGYNGLNVGNVTTFNVTGLTAGTTYFYRVRATNSCGTSANSGTITYATSPATPAAPVSTAGTNATCTQITANWNASANATSYILDVSTVNTFASFVAGFNGLNVGNVTTYDVPGLTAGTTYFYRVRATNSCGTSANSGTITYATSPATPATPGVITGTTPQCENTAGQVYSISAVANATTYTWTVPAGWTITAGQGTISITVTTGSAGSNGNITVTAGNSCGTSSAQTKAVTVNANPTIADAGPDQTICETTTTVTLAANTPAIGTGTWSIGAGSSNLNLAQFSSTSSPTAIFNPTTTPGTYKLIWTITNSPCTSSKDTMTLTVNASPVNRTVAPATATICSGSSVNITVTSATSGVEYRLRNDADNSTIGSPQTGAGATLTFSTGVLTTTTTFNVLATAANGCTLQMTTKPVITVNPLPTVTLGSNPIVCRGTTTATLTYINPTNGANQYSIDYDATANTNGFTDVGITALPVSPFNLVVPAAVPPATYNANLTIKNSTTGCISVYAISITVNARPTSLISGSISICNGSSTNIAITVTGSGTISGTLSDGTAFSGTAPTINVSVSPVTTTIYSVSTLTDANCTAIAGDKVGTYTVTVNNPVVITSQPTSHTICSSFPDTLKVVATGTGLSYQWYKNGVAMTTSANIPSVTSANLVFVQITTADAGNYYVIVSGTAPCSPLQSNTVTITVNEEITITTQPQPVTICEFGNAVFSVTANTSSGTLTYQWRKGTTNLTNGGAISGATTATLTLTNIDTSYQGSYNVVITATGSVCPQAFSNPALLTIYPTAYVNKGTLLLHEPFTSMSVGNLGGQNSWTSAGSGVHVNNVSPITYTDYGSQCTYSEIGTGGGNDAVKNFTSTVSTSTNSSIWVSFLVNVSSSGASSGPTYCVDLVSGNAQELSRFFAQSNNGNLLFGIAGDNTGNGFPGASTPASYVFGQTYFIVMRYDIISGSNNDSMFLWVNPSLASQPSTSTANAKLKTAAELAYGSTINSLLIQPTSNQTGGAPHAQFDDFKVSTDWSNLIFPVDASYYTGNTVYSMAFSSNVSGATFSWTSTVDIGFGTSGTGSIPQFTATNAGSSPVTTTVTVYATANGCTGPAQSFTITVKPSPNGAASPVSQSICSADAFSLGLSGTTGATYDWVRDNTTNVTSSVGNSGSTDAATGLSGTLTNNTTTAQTVTFTFTPRTECKVGTTFTATIIVNPKPTITLTSAAVTVCQGTTTANFPYSATTASPTLYSVDWNAAANTAGFVDVSNVSLPASPISLAVPAAGAGGTYTGTLTVSTPACTSIAYTITVTINSVTSGTVGSDQVFCGSGDPVAFTQIVAATALDPTPTYQWQSSTDDCTTGFANVAGGTGSTFNSGVVSDSTWFIRIVTSTVNGVGCSDTTSCVLVAINPSPVVSAGLPQTVCTGGSITVTGTIGGSASSATWSAPSGTFGNPNSLSTTYTPSIGSGTVTLTLTTDDPAGPCTSVFTTVTITVSPLTVSLVASPTILCSGSSSTLTATTSGGSTNRIFSGTSGVVNQHIPGHNNSSYSYPSIPLGGSGGATLQASDIIILTLNIHHGDDADLDIYLVDPSGTRAMEITTDNGGTSNNFTNTILRTDAVTNITTGSAPFTGTFRPEGTPSTVPILTGAYSGGDYTLVVPAATLLSSGGAPIDGNWTLRIFDDQMGSDNGYIISWSLAIQRATTYTTTINEGATSITPITYSGANNSIATATVTPTAGTHTYTATTTDGNGCIVTSSSATVTVSATPTVSNAGSNQSICSPASATLAANNPVNGTGAWSVVSGPSLLLTQFNSTASPTAIFTPAGGTGVYTLRWTISNSPCAASTSDVTITVSATPTITLGANPSICKGITSANLPYTATTGSPNQYSIDFNAAAEAQGFVDVTNVALPASPIIITVPAGAAAGTYNANLTVRNSATGCVSSITAITITVKPLPGPITITHN